MSIRRKRIRHVYVYTKNTHKRNVEKPDSNTFHVTYNASDGQNPCVAL